MSITVFISNIPFSATEEDIRFGLENAGVSFDPTTEMILFKDRDTNKFKGTVKVVNLSRLPRDCPFTFEIELTNCIVKFDIDDIRHPDGSFIYQSNPNIQRSLRGIQLTTSDIPLLPILSSTFMKKYGITDRSCKRICFGPVKKVGRTAMQEFFQQFGTVSMINDIPVKNPVSGGRGTNTQEQCLYKITFKYPLDAVQAMVASHGTHKFGNPIPHSRLDHQPNPNKEFNHRGLKPDGSILVVADEIRQFEFVRTCVLDPEVLDSFCLQGRFCTDCHANTNVAGISPDFRKAYLECQHVIENPNSTTEQVTLPLIAVKYPKNQDYKETMLKILKEERRAAKALKSVIRIPVRMVGWKTIELNQAGDVISYVCILHAVVEDPSQHLCVGEKVRAHYEDPTISCSNQVEGMFVKGKVVHLGDGDQHISVMIKFKKLSCEVPNWEHVKLEPVEKESTWRSLRQGVECLTDKSTNPIVELFLGRTTITQRIVGSENILLPKDLNDEQGRGLGNSIKQSLSIHIGPPGTGKTHLAAHIGIEAFKHDAGFYSEERLNAKVLACAGSNRAADELASKLAALSRADGCSIQVVRVYAKPMERTSSSEDVDFTILHQEVDANLEQNQEFLVFRSNLNGKKFYELKKSEEAQLLQFRSDAESTILEHANILVCTNQTSADHRFRGSGVEFSTILIDEAGNMTEPLSILPIVKASQNFPTRVVFLGDYRQLKPFVYSMDSYRAGYGRSLMERIIIGMILTGKADKDKIVVQLTENYRSHPLLVKLTSEIFYLTSLTTNVDPNQRKLDVEITNSPHLSTLNENPILLVNYTNGLETKVGDSYVNETEVNIVTGFIQDLIRSGVAPTSIAILSFYDEQTKQLRISLNRNQCEKSKLVKVTNVDGYQGRENDIVFVSCVRANKFNHIGFLKEANRINVATSRGRLALVMLCKMATFEGSKDNVWKKLLDFVKTEVGTPLPVAHYNYGQTASTLASAGVVLHFIVK